MFAFGVRLFEIKHAYNIFVDEISYVQVSHNLASGAGLSLYGKPFDLHPPLTFVVLAGVIKVFSLGNLQPDALVLDLRPVMALFGAATVAITYLVARRCGLGTVGAVIAGVIVAADPFALLYDSRVLLEPVAQLFVILTMLALLKLNESRTLTEDRWVLVAGGLSAGAAFSTKETFALVLALALVLIAVWPGLRIRRKTLTVLGIGAAVYAVVILAVCLTSGFDAWWVAHTSGLSRLIGTHQTTGFNAATTKVSLESRAAADVGQFASSYVLLVLGVIAAFYRLWQGWRDRETAMSAQLHARTVLALWSAAGAIYLAYATVFGSIEEQMYYILLAPSIINVALLTAELAQVRSKRLGTSLVAVGTVLTLGFSTVVWANVHSRDNDIYSQFFAWEKATVAPDARIGVTEDVAQFVLKDAVIGKWTTLQELRKNRADYVLVNSTLVQQGYSAMTEATFQYLLAHAPIAFVVHSPHDGTLYFFDVENLA